MQKMTWLPSTSDVKRADQDTHRVTGCFIAVFPGQQVLGKRTRVNEASAYMTSCFKNYLTFLHQGFSLRATPRAPPLQHSHCSIFLLGAGQRGGSCDTTLPEDVINGFFSMTHAVVSSAVQLRNIHTQILHNPSKVSVLCTSIHSFKR